jgi:hypothetical protein
VTRSANYLRAREETCASRHANGTGPFMLESFEPRGRWVMVRNPARWGTAEYPHNVDRVVHTRKEGDAANVAALLERHDERLQVNGRRANFDLKGGRASGIRESRLRVQELTFHDCADKPTISRSQRGTSSKSPRS